MDAILDKIELAIAQLGQGMAQRRQGIAQCYTDHGGVKPPQEVADV